MRVACDLVENVDSVSEGLRVCLSNKPLGLIHAAVSQNTLSVVRLKCTFTWALLVFKCKYNRYHALKYKIIVTARKTGMFRQLC